jgi:hypothetical protein
MEHRALISYIDEDGTHEDDGVAGISYLTQVNEAIEG